MNKSYLKGLNYFILSLFISCTNDALSKHLINQQISSWQITLFRLLIGVLLLLCYGLYKGEFAQLPTPVAFSQHGLRGLLFVIASTLWTYSLTELPMPTVTLMSFTIPLFILLLSPPLLGEKVSLRLWLPTSAAVFGVALLLFPYMQPIRLRTSAIALLAAVIGFALLDVLNKKYLAKVSIFDMIFYSNSLATCMIIPLAYKHWQPLHVKTALPLVALGIGGILLLYVLLKAYQYARIVSLAPIRYVELLLSIGFSYIFFHQMPQAYQLWSALIIMPSLFFIIYDQNQKEEK